MGGWGGGGRSGHQVAEDVVASHKVGLAIYFYDSHTSLMLCHPQQPLAGDTGLLLAGSGEASLTELCECSL